MQVYVICQKYDSLIGIIGDIVKLVLTSVSLYSKGQTGFTNTFNHLSTIGKIKVLNCFSIRASKHLQKFTKMGHSDFPQVWQTDYAPRYFKKCKQISTYRMETGFLHVRVK